VFERMFDGDTRLFLRIALTDTVTTVLRHILYFTEREPDVTSGHSGLNRLLGGTRADSIQNDVVSESAPVALAELICHSQPEFTQSHKITLTGKTPAHRAGVFDACLARHQVGAELRDEVVGQCIGDNTLLNNSEALDDRETVTDLAHDHRDGRLECICNRRENLATRFFLPTLHLAEVTERDARLAGDLAEGATLLQTEVAEYVTDFLTNQNHLTLLI